MELSENTLYRNEILVSAREKGIEIVTDIEIFTKESKSTKLLIKDLNFITAQMF